MAKKEKFKFGVDFQELILQYTVTNPMGYKVLALYDDSYFDLIHHSLIAYALKKYYKKNKRIPDKPFLREFLRGLYQTDKGIALNLTNEDKQQVEGVVTNIYDKEVAEPDEIVDKCVKFARFVKFKEELEDVDLANFDSYANSITKLQKANNIGFDLQDNHGTFLVKGMNDRAHKRDILTAAHPTPFKQLNRLLNPGGTTTGNVFVVMSTEKSFKTGALVNIAGGYLRMRKKVAYVDLENGETNITVRTEQKITHQDQTMIMSGDYDNKLIKIMRKYARIGSEMAIKRFPSLKTTCDDVQVWLDGLKRDYDFIPQVVVFDYGLLLGAISGKTDDFARISDAFLDIKNFSEYNKLECVWTAAHTTREGEKRFKSTFKATDIAKCIDIPRHVDAILGLQQNDEEYEAGVMRFEVVEQRNGMKSGKCLFWVDIKTQNMKEFNHKQVEDYYKQISMDKDEDDEDLKPKKPRKTDLDE